MRSFLGSVAESLGISKKKHSAPPAARPEWRPLRSVTQNSALAGEPRDEALQRDEAQARLVADAQQRQQQQTQSRKRHASPAGWPPSDEPAAAAAAAPAPALTVHDLYSGAPVVAEAPAGDGGLQSLHDSQATWNRTVKMAQLAATHRSGSRRSMLRAASGPRGGPWPLVPERGALAWARSHRLPRAVWPLRLTDDDDGDRRPGLLKGVRAFGSGSA